MGGHATPSQVLDMCGAILCALCSSLAELGGLILLPKANEIKCVCTILDAVQAACCAQKGPVLPLDRGGANQNVCLSHQPHLHAKRGKGEHRYA